ncbi:MAG TPA: DUF1294 domain-containing protein [Patescibacteria group bacterium]|nr:DUF1294 domain-containing protein [Patescibacteria group bacterium]
MPQYLFYYLLAINIITFVVFVWDKQRAIYNQRRVPEKVLWLMALVGGSVGAIAGMEIAKHKRKKISFVLVLYLILLLQAMGIYLMLKK